MQNVSGKLNSGNVINYTVVNEKANKSDVDRNIRNSILAQECCDDNIVVSSFRESRLRSLHISDEDAIALLQKPDEYDTRAINETAKKSTKKRIIDIIINVTLFFLGLFFNSTLSIAETYVLGDKKEHPFNLNVMYMYPYIITVILGTIFVYIKYGKAQVIDTFNPCFLIRASPYAATSVTTNITNLKVQMYLQGPLAKLAQQFKLVLSVFAYATIFRHKITYSEWFSTFGIFSSMLAYLFFSVDTGFHVTNIRYLFISLAAIFAGIVTGNYNETLFDKYPGPVIIQIIRNSVNGFLGSIIWIAITLTTKKEWRYFPFTGFSPSVWLLIILETSKLFVIVAMVVRISNLYKALCTVASALVWYTVSCFVLRKFPFNPIVFGCLLASSMNVLSFTFARKEKSDVALATKTFKAQTQFEGAVVLNPRL